MRLVGIRRGTALLCVSALALAVWACETARHIGGIQADTQKPSITLGNAAGDTQDIAGGLRFTVSAVDNLALKSVDLTFSGGLIGTLDTTFVGQVKTYAVRHAPLAPQIRSARWLGRESHRRHPAREPQPRLGAAARRAAAFDRGARLCVRRRRGAQLLVYEYDDAAAQRAQYARAATRRQAGGAAALTQRADRHRDRGQRGDG